MGIEGRERYIDPYTDFGFKKLFGTELNKDLLISFLNSIFNNNAKEIKDVKYLNGEHLGDGYGDRRSVFDVYCMTEDGSRFIVEIIFKRLFDQAEIAKFNERERREYEESVKDYRDYYSTVKTAHKKGKAEGRAEERLANARRMKADNLPIELISKYTGLTSEEIAAI